MRLSFYTADADYCNFLRKKDPRVPYTADGKSTRPFVGIVFEINSVKYYAPLTSPKPKHIKMKNQVDFYKINGGEWGAINFNNMIPIHNESLKIININHLPEMTEEDRQYKNLLINQLSWCNANKKAIVVKAERLYQVITENSGNQNLKERCCNFLLDEQLYREFTQSGTVK